MATFHSRLGGANLGPPLHGFRLLTTEIAPARGTGVQLVSEKSVRTRECRLKASDPQVDGTMRRRSRMTATCNRDQSEAPGRDSGAAVMEGGSGCSVGKRSATIQR